HPGGSKALVELAPADDAGVGDELDEVVVAPACVAGQGFDALDLHTLAPRYWDVGTAAPKLARTAFAMAAARVFGTCPRAQVPAQDSLRAPWGSARMTCDQGF